MPSTERERIAANDRLHSDMSRVYRALESEYDVITSDNLIMEDKFHNSVCVTLKTKYDVYKNRIYGEGDGHYHVTQNLDVYEGTNLKFGKVKTDEEDVSKEQRFFLFKKGSLSNVQSAFSRLSSKAERYFTMKSVHSTRKPASQHTFNFYIATVVLTLISVLVFVGFMIQGFVGYFKDKSISNTLAKSVFGGAKTLWLILAVSFVLAIIGFIVHKKSIKPLRPTGRGFRNIDFTKHSFIVVAIEFVSILFALLLGSEGIIAAIGNLIFPALLACIIYPIVLFVFLGQCRDEFDVKYILRDAATMLSDTQYAELQDAEQIVKAAKINRDITEIREILLRVIDEETELSITY